MASIQYSNSAIGNFTYGWDANHKKSLLPANLSGLGTSLGLKWDSNNKLRAADTNNDGTDDVLYLWDALGRRVGRTASGITTVYFQNGEQTLADYTLGALPSSPTYTYLWGGYIDELVMRTSTGGNHYFHRNQQYSVRVVTTSAGTVAERYAYTAYGQPTILNASASPIASSTISNRYMYTGREWDATLGLYHFRARWMSGLAGRFMGRDPIGYVDGSSLYQIYFSLNGVDPSGLDTILLPFPSENGPNEPSMEPQIGVTPGNGIPGPPHNVGGPEELPLGDNRCSQSDTCAVLEQKSANFVRAIRSHRLWDLLHPYDPRWPNGRHFSEIVDMERGLARCFAIYTQNKCRNPPRTRCPQPQPQPQPVPVPTAPPIIPLCEVRLEPRTVVVCAGGAAGGYVCYRVIRMIPSIFCPPTALPNLIFP